MSSGVSQNSMHVTSSASHSAGSSLGERERQPLAGLVDPALPGTRDRDSMEIEAVRPGHVLIFAPSRRLSQRNMRRGGQGPAPDRALEGIGRNVAEASFDHASRDLLTKHLDHLAVDPFPRAALVCDQPGPHAPHRRPRRHDPERRDRYVGWCCARVIHLEQWRGVKAVLTPVNHGMTTNKPGSSHTGAPKRTDVGRACAIDRGGAGCVGNCQRCSSYSESLS
jgi:hypothetical protein